MLFCLIYNKTRFYFQLKVSKASVLCPAKEPKQLLLSLQKKQNGRGGFTAP